MKVLIVMAFLMNTYSWAVTNLSCSGKSTSDKGSIQFSKSVDGSKIILQLNIFNVFSFQEYTIIKNSTPKIYIKSANYGMTISNETFPNTISLDKDKNTQFNLITIGSKKYFYSCLGENPYL